MSKTAHLFSPLFPGRPVPAREPAPPIVQRSHVRHTGDDASLGGATVPVGSFGGGRPVVIFRDGVRPQPGECPKAALERHVREAFGRGGVAIV